MTNNPLALSSKGLDAIIRVTSICLHPVDFKSHKFKTFTISTLEASLSQQVIDSDSQI